MKDIRPSADKRPSAVEATGLAIGCQEVVLMGTAQA
jgi:hypothetical protein